MDFVHKVTYFKLQARGQFGALADCPFGIKFCGKGGAAYPMEARTGLIRLFGHQFGQ